MKPSSNNLRWILDRAMTLFTIFFLKYLKGTEVDLCLLMHDPYAYFKVLLVIKWAQFNLLVFASMYDTGDHLKIPFTVEAANFCFLEILDGRSLPQHC